MPTRARKELLVAAGIVFVLLVIAVATGNVLRPNDDPDPRASSFLASRSGVKGAADAIERVGVQVVRWRRRTRALDRQLGEVPTTFAVVAPVVAPTPDELRELLAFGADSGRGDLFLAGEGLAPLMRCFGFGVFESVIDSVHAAPHGTTTRNDDPWVHAYLTPASDSVRRPRRSLLDGEDFTCERIAVARIDTLVTNANRHPVAVRLARGDGSGDVTLVADAALLQNRVLRESRTAPVLLDALIGGNGRVVFDEYHQRFGEGGSMARIALAWSARNPIGWMTWQLVAVALLALVAGAVRFGPVRPAIPRTRRSPLEHVRALATALSASHGHAVAIGAIVRGLRRRLSPASTTVADRSRDDWREWLDSLVRHAPSPRARTSAERLLRAADDPQPDAAVLAAAHAVEDLWKDLRP
jgi:hypothetical protein